MAAPSSVTVKDLNGKWSMNKSLSDNFEPVLALQGMSWLTRKALGLASVTLSIKHYADSNRTAHIDIDLTLTGGIKGTSENRTLDSQRRSHEDHIFGLVEGYSHYTSLSSLTTSETELTAEDVEYLKEGWAEESRGEEGVVESFVVSKPKEGSGVTPWTGRQIWGFEDVRGERRYVRHIVVRKGEEVVRVKLVYDYLGPLGGKEEEELDVEY